MSVAATSGGFERTGALIEVPAYPVGSLLDQIDIVGTREGGSLLEAYVPLDLIQSDDTDVPIDYGHVDELVELMKDEMVEHGGTTGQVHPIELAEIAGFDNFVTIDGFHRTPALKIIGASAAYAIVRPDCTWEKAYDLRIKAARAHKSVQFARVVEWINELWNQTPWTGRLEADQAFHLAAFKTSGRRLGLDAEEAEAIKEWARQRCEQWSLTPASVMLHLDTAKKAAPDLVKQARNSTSGRRLEYVTPGHLRVLVAEIPHRYDLQRLLATAITANNATVPKARAAVQMLRNVASVEEGMAIISSIDWEKLEPAYSPSRARELQQKGPDVDAITARNAELLEKLLEQAVLIGKLVVELAVAQGDYTPSNERDKGLIQAILTLNLASDPARLRSGPAIAVRDILSKLPSTESQLVVLHHLFGLSALAISQILGEYPDDIRGQLTTVREKLGLPDAATAIVIEPSPVTELPAADEVEDVTPPEKEGDKADASGDQLEVDSRIIYKFGIVEIDSEDWDSGARTKAVIRVQNLNAVNEKTRQVAAQYDLPINRLMLEDTRITWGTRIIDGPVETELLNVLLAAYMREPMSLAEAHSVYGLGENLSDTALATRMEKVHKLCLQLAAQGMVYYNPATQNGLALKPVLIEEKRPPSKSLI